MSPVIKNRLGFTMIEIMIVIAIMTILTTIAVTSLRTVSLRQQKNAAANEISALLHQARSMARSSSVQATVTVVTVATVPGGSVQATISAPVNWTQTVSLGLGGSGSYSAVGLVAATPAGPYTISPRGTVSPAPITLTLRDRDFAVSGEQALVTVGLLGDITVTP